jgi:hypothetical protein
MPIRCCSALVLTLLATTAWAADLTTLKGDVVKGEVVSISDKEVVLDQDGTRLKKPLEEVLKISFRDPGRVPAGTAFARVELVDGSAFACSKWSIKRKDVELKLLAGPTLKLPLSSVANILAKAEVEDNRNDWKTRVASKRGKDVLVVIPEDSDRPSNLDVTLGEGDEKGEKIGFAISLGGTVVERTRRLDNLHGLIFKNTLSAKAPPMVCKLLDTHQDVVMVSSVKLDGGNVQVETPASAKLTFRVDALARLDYSPGRLEFISDMEWLTFKASSTLESPDNPQQQVYKDSSMLTNPDGSSEPITIGGTSYPKGLTLRPTVEVVYELKGEYREFSARVGIDDRVPLGEGPVEIVIEGDGRELKTVAFAPKDARKFEDVKLNIKDVQRLRIVVRSRGRFENMKHIALGDAKVTKVGD